MHPHLSRYLDHCRSNGIATMLLAAALHQISRELAFHYLLVQAERAMPDPRPGLTWRLLEDGDIPLLAFMDPVMAPREVAARRSQGMECFLFWRQEKLVHYRWFAPRSFHDRHLALKMELDPQTAMATGAYTPPAWRRQGLLRLSTQALIAYLRDRGYRRLVGTRAWWNRSTKHYFGDKSGFQPLGRVWCWRLGSWRRYYAQGRLSIDQGSLRFRFRD